ncbi:phenylalanine--tRNA ligase subunit beta [Aeromicrobium sp.]|nr:phenylalanine--tRNA ligase subunit beta [Candidatus Saccharibacteria bacterium]
MKISVQKLRQFGGQGLDLPIADLVTRIGSQLGGVEAVEDVGAKYQGVVVAKIVKCQDHPNADRLHVCSVDDGGMTANVDRDADGNVQVVCGAPNVREGMLVAWLPPGATVPDSVAGDPFILEARELRGVVSNGMLASAKELAISDDHEGILEIDSTTAKPGDAFAEAYKLNDYLIDIENKMFTHRPDCFGQLGVAREASGIQQLAFHSPDWYVMNPVFPAIDGTELMFNVSNELPSEVPRFAAIAMSNILISPSPAWLQTELSRLGMRSINNIVDLTNYYMLLTGQPIHAYDYDKVKALSSGDTAQIVIRNPRESEKITLLNGKTIDPRQEAIMIATDQQLIGVAGVMGGAETEVDDKTTNIIIEVGTFDMYSIRRTSMAHGLFTDAVTRFNKGQSPLQNLAVMAKIVDDIQRLAQGRVASQVVDVSQVEGREWVHPPVPVTTDFINLRLGFQLSADEMKQLLENVEFKVQIDGMNMSITAPFWRTDVETREDVVEEIGRLYGFEHLPQILPMRSIAPVAKNQLFELKGQLRDVLSRAGANEILTYSFVHGDLFDKVGQDKSLAYKLSNALSPGLQYYRMSLTPSVLEKVQPNIKAGHDEFVLFELGKSHIQGEIDNTEEGVPKEANAVSVVYATKLPTKTAPYYQVRHYLDWVLRSFRVTDTIKLVSLQDAELYKNPWLEQMIAPFEPGRSAVLVDISESETAGMIWGVVGEYRPSVTKALKLPAATAGFEIDPLVLLKPSGSTPYKALSRFPSVTQDLTLRITSGASYQSLAAVVRNTLEKTVPSKALLTMEPTSIFQRPDDIEHKQVTFRISIASYERTLTDAEVSNFLAEAASAAHNSVGAETV